MKRMSEKKGVPRGNRLAKGIVIFLVPSVQAALVAAYEGIGWGARAACEAGRNGIMQKTVIFVEKVRII